MESTSHAARFLDMTDRVEILGSIIQSFDGGIESESVNCLLGEYYPSLLHFYADVPLTKDTVVEIHAAFEENQVCFATILRDGTCMDYRYSDIDDLLL